MSGVNKPTTDRNQRVLLDLALKPGNDICADCKARHPRWASHNLGIFICVNCASIHRKIGTHITKVKSLTMDSWTKEQVEHMKNTGNVKSNAIFNSNEIRHPPPPNLEDSERDSELEQYIRSKYEYKRFLDKSALVASKLGPSRSASSIPPRSASISEPKSAGVGASHSANAAVFSSSTHTATSIAAGGRYTPTSRPSTTSATPVQQYTPAPTQQYTSAPPRAIESRAVPQQMAGTTMQPPPQSQNGAPGGVWDDLVSLQTSSTTSSSTLPLQYQASVSPAFTGMSLQGMNQNSLQQSPFSPGNSGGYQMSMSATGMSGNPYQQQQFTTNPYSQQQSQPTYAMNSMSTPFSAPAQFNPSMSQSQQSYGQQLFSNQMQMQQQPQSAMSASAQGQFFQPQPQSHSSLQIQVPQQGSNGFLAPSPIQPFMSAPVGQTQFLTPSPNQQFLSHSPQPSPQPMGMMGSPGQQQMIGSPAGQQPQMMGSPSPGAYMSSGPMQQFMGGAPQQMMSQGQFGGGYQAQGYMQGGYPSAQQQQWGNM